MHIRRGGAAGLVQARWLGDSSLLAGETDGMAINFTAVSPMVQVRTSSVDEFIDPSVFFSGSPSISGNGLAVGIGIAVTVAVSEFPFSATNGTLIGEYVFTDATAVADTNSPSMVVFSNATPSEMIRFARSATTNVAGFSLVDGGSTVVNVLDAGTMAGTPTINKFAGAWAANNTNAVLNGTAGTNDTSCTIPTVTTMYLGHRHGDIDRWPGFIRKLIYVPRRMTDAEMQGHTS
jgi:hypothetical protein